jgi:hypothetical protein
MITGIRTESLGVILPMDMDSLLVVPGRCAADSSAGEVDRRGYRAGYAPQPARLHPTLE